MDTPFWSFIGAEVWAPTTGECSSYDDCYQEIPDYGPHIRWVPDPAGHNPTIDRTLQGKWLAVDCECGWRDLDFNYPQHLKASSRRKIAVLS